MQIARTLPLPRHRWPDCENAPLLSPVAQGERNHRPMVILHGSMVNKDSIEDFRNFARNRGYHVDHRTYPGIRDGAPIEESSRLVSRNINRARLEIARKHLDQLQGADTNQLAEFFQLDGDHTAIRQALPQFVEDVRSVCGLPQDQLEQSLSGRIKQIQDELQTRLAEAGVGTSQKVAAELVDSLVPKAVLVGHSAGGVVAYNVAVNPQAPGEKADPFHYDGGNGVGSVMLLAAPVKSGMPEPLPPGLADLPFYNFNKDVLTPMESNPVWQLARLNPLVDVAYQANKSLAQTGWHVAMMTSAALTNPLTYVTKPGFGQVMASSSFLRDHIQNKTIPNDVTVLGLTTPSDAMALTERSRLDETQPNAHNFELEIETEPGQLKRERPTWSHVRMAELPWEFEAQMAQQIAHDPKELARLLDPANDDGARCMALQWLERQMAEEPGILQTPGIRKALLAVAREEMPFRDSPSAQARRLLLQ